MSVVHAHDLFVVTVVGVLHSGVWCGHMCVLHVCVHKCVISQCVCVILFVILLLHVVR